MLPRTQQCITILTLSALKLFCSSSVSLVVTVLLKDVPAVIARIQTSTCREGFRRRIFGIEEQRPSSKGFFADLSVSDQRYRSAAYTAASADTVPDISSKILMSVETSLMPVYLFAILATPSPSALLDFPAARTGYVRVSATLCGYPGLTSSLKRFDGEVLSSRVWTYVLAIFCLRERLPGAARAFTGVYVAGHYELMLGDMLMRVVLARWSKRTGDTYLRLVCQRLVAVINSVICPGANNVQKETVIWLVHR